MDNYDLSNLLLLGHCADFREHHSWLTDEENRRATFSGRSATVSSSEQVERKQLPSIGDEQPEQKVLDNFDISLASTTSAATRTVDEPEDPFAALAAYTTSLAYHYQLLTSNDDTGQSLNNNLGLFGNINTSSEAVLAKLPLPRGTATESQAAIMPEKSATSRKNTKRQDPDESLRKYVKEETNKWIVECKDSSARKRFMCSYPDCGWIFSRVAIYLKVHIFRHIHISLYRYTYPECADNPYFCSSSNLTRHVQIFHKKK